MTHQLNYLLLLILNRSRWFPSLFQWWCWFFTISPWVKNICCFDPTVKYLGTIKTKMHISAHTSFFSDALLCLIRSCKQILPVFNKVFSVLSFQDVWGCGALTLWSLWRRWKNNERTFLFGDFIFFSVSLVFNMPFITRVWTGKRLCVCRKIKF